MSIRNPHEAGSSVLGISLPYSAKTKRRAPRAREQRPRVTLTTTPFTASATRPADIDSAAVRIAVLAMENLARASMRASFTGIEVHVAVPDETTAAIFRAALSETGRTRVTDRLVRVVIGE